MRGETMVISSEEEEKEDDDDDDDDARSVVDSAANFSNTQGLDRPPPL